MKSISGRVVRISVVVICIGLMLCIWPFSAIGRYHDLTVCGLSDGEDHQ